MRPKVLVRIVTCVGQNGLLKVEGFNSGCLKKKPWPRFFTIFFSFFKSGLSNTRPADFFRYRLLTSRNFENFAVIIFIAKHKKENSCKTKYKSVYILEYFYTEKFKHEEIRVNMVLYVAVQDVKLVFGFCALLTEARTITWNVSDHLATNLLKIPEICLHLTTFCNK